MSIEISPDLVAPLHELLIQISHAPANKDSLKKDKIAIQIKTDARPGRGRITKIDNLVLEETGEDTGVFAGRIQLTTNRKKIPGDLEVLPEDLITFSYDTRQLGRIPGLRHARFSKTVEVKTWDPEFVVDKKYYNIGDQVVVLVNDPGANRSPERADVINLNVFSTSDRNGLTIQASESGLDMGVFEAKFRLSKSRSGKDAILVHGGEEVTITYKSELPANYLEHIENKRDPKEAFFFSFKVNSPLRPKDVLNDMKKYLDPSVFEKIRRGEFLGLRKMPITVAFWDIRGFSQMCDILRADTKLIVGFLRDYSDLATQVITKHGGILDKFIGDGVMALFGVFENDSDEAAVAAVSAALEFRSGFNKLLEKWMPIWSSTQEQSFTIEIGCGINTGEAMVGSLGGIREQFTAVGRSVNIASRLENRSKENKILISRTTQKRVNSFFETRYVGTIRSMKNIVGNYPYYEVIKKSKHLPEIEVDYT